MTLYLKYRPQKISELDLVSVREMLGEMLKSDKLPHAWLFVGPRGTGKTSAARILAKTVNCKHKKKDGEPCNECETCMEITAGAAVDVIEIDAASNRGIDEIRELRDRIKLTPLAAEYKVYIIDEVHMLTTEAANALLKTLEEPPKHAIFVLCTTDAQKLPETVVSRCTRIQFKLPTVAEITAKLQAVVKNEKLKMKDEELELIARASRGSFRDGIKILEQAWLSGQSAAEVLGMLESADPAEFIKILRDKDTKKALDFVNKMVGEGVSPRNFIERCVEELREEMLNGAADAVGLIRGLEEAYERSRTSAVPQLPLEIFVIENSKSVIPRSGDDAPLVKSEPKLEPKIKSIKPNPGRGKYKLEDVQAKWQEILKAVRPKNHSVEALLRSTRPVEFDGEELALEVFYKFHRDKLESERCRQIVEEAVGEVFGTGGIRLKLNLGEKGQAKKEEIAAQVEEDIISAAEEIFKVDAV